MDHPPSTTRSPRVARRAIATSVTALLAIVAPIVVVAATAGGADTPAVAAAGPAKPNNDIKAQFASKPQLARISAPTTTTTAPPAPPPTAAPPPPPPPPPVVQPVATGGGYSDPNNPAAWDRLARCESGGNWAINTGNGYYGGLQFSLGSWQGAGGTGRPDQASRETQIAIGQRLYHSGGWGHWPACTRKLGYR